MRGASALQRVLEQRPVSPVTIFVVWEPVLATDRFAPTTNTLARISDPRARQYWDHERLVSSAIGGAAGYPPGDIVWDFVGIYPPGVRWGAGVDAPSWSGAPVVDVVDELRARLASLEVSAVGAR